MSSSNANAETAERLNRRRARMLPVLALFVLIQQAAFFSSGDRLRTVDLVRNSGWIMLVAVILAGLVTGGFWFRSREVRQLMNDEVTVANRGSAVTWGFTMAIVAAIVLFAIESFTPDGASSREVIHIITSAGLVTALLRWGFLERRALG
jgi:fucose 4-O-acetylase-like acetyltransferase